MKFLHISDLHIGKKMNGYSLEEDQRHILSQIIDICKKEKPNGVLIAGDIYDTSSPGNESYSILDTFLTELSSLNVEIFISSGNHDSQEKLSFGSKLFETNGIHIAGLFSGSAECYSVVDDNDTIDVYMLPFVKPASVRRLHSEETMNGYGDAVAVALKHTPLSKNKKILMCHQFVVGSVSPELSDSENPIVGTVEAVPADLFDDFDYVALGHLHLPQNITKKIRYCGSPLKYSKSECGREKSVTIIEFNNGEAVDDVSIKTIPLIPLRDVRTVTGTVDEIISQGKNDPNNNDFIYCVVMEKDPIDALTRIRDVYPNMLSMETMDSDGYDGTLSFEPCNQINPLELFSKLFEEMKGFPLTDKQKKIVLDSMKPEASE